MAFTPVFLCFVLSQVHIYIQFRPLKLVRFTRYFFITKTFAIELFPGLFFPFRLTQHQRPMFRNRKRLEPVPVVYRRFYLPVGNDQPLVTNAQRVRSSRDLHAPVSLDVDLDKLGFQTHNGLCRMHPHKFDWSAVDRYLGRVRLDDLDTVYNNLEQKQSISLLFYLI